ncbi:MAG TPA: HD domain-containing protein [Gammaproteobacteria bacterium]|nr:HD domain-containing protein [Gammaproteobacteria bacterium]
MIDHKDILGELDFDIPLKEKLICTHEAIKQHFPFIARIAITIYDPVTTVLKTYLHSSDGDSPLNNYQARLDDAPSLKALLEKGKPRVINNMLTFEDATHEHTRRIGRSGYASSYTMPMFHNSRFFGFIFFNSRQINSFKPEVLYELDMIGHMLSLMVVSELESVHTLLAAIKTTGHITHLRDPETGSHLDRMSRYSRLVAVTLAEKYDLDDDYIEHIFLFSPLHDIGKIAIPDHILLKAGNLDEHETTIMQTHAQKGRDIIDGLLKNFSLENFYHIDILRNIIGLHHEAIDGRGYPTGIKGDDIPLEARIVAVADVFDALTSRRPYKSAWSIDHAFEELNQLADNKLDRNCVDALVTNRSEVESIQQQFSENPF